MDLSTLVLSNSFHELILAAALGAIIGLERELAGKDPSLRTFALISLGSCLFSIISVESAQGVTGAEPGRIAAQVVSGIGFLGAGAIFRSRHGIAGLTTATLMWVTAAIGMAVGFGKSDIAIDATVIGVTTMYVLKLVHRILDKIKPDRAVRINPEEHANE